MRHKILGLLVIVIIICSACMSIEGTEVKEEIEASSARPVMVPYLNRNIKDITAEPEQKETTFGAVLDCVGIYEGNTEPVPEYDLVYLGDWTTTAYCPCPICCGEWATGCTASGVLATSNHTVACGILPFGTEVVIDGIIYTVEDTGVSGEWIDIFFDSHDEALAYGMQTKSVYKVVR